MSKRFPLAKWVLPAVINPSTSTCFLVPVPNDRNHRAAFMGAILSLASAYKWQDDDAHTAVLVAQVWRNIFYNLRAQLCEIPTVESGVVLEDMLSQQIRISPDDRCIIQMWCIDHWEDWYDPRHCISTGSGQGTAPDGPPGPGETQEYCFTVQARTPYLYPVPVNTSDLITVSDVTGAWTDGVGGLVALWKCPNGQAYTLGVCSGGTTTDASDPMPAEPHMGLIAFIDGDYYYIGAGDTFVVPAGITDADMLFLPNTDDRSIASGSVACCVSITRSGPLPIQLTYSFGSGVTAIEDGGIFTLTSSNNAGQQRFDVQSALECVKWEVLSSAGWVTVGSSGSPFWADCASGPHNHTGADIAPEIWLADVDGVQIICNGASVFTCQVRVSRL